MKSWLVLLAALSPLVLLAQLDLEDIRFCVEREHWDLLAQHMDDLEHFRETDPDIYYPAYYGVLRAQGDTLALRNAIYATALERQCLESAWTWLNMLPPEHDELDETRILLLRSEAFSAPADRDCFDLMVVWEQMGEVVRSEEQDRLLSLYGEANVTLESWLKEKIDEIAVERSDSLRLVMIDKVETLVPHSSWSPALLHLRLRTLRALRRWDDVDALLMEAVQSQPGVEETYFLALHLADPDLRDSLRAGAALLNQADVLLNRLRMKLSAAPVSATYHLLYDEYTAQEMIWKTDVLLAKVLYAQMEQLSPGDTAWNALRDQAMALLDGVRWPDNDTGEQAELHYWRGMLGKDAPDDTTRLEAAREFVRCLSAGAPRKRYDVIAMEHLTALAAELAPGRDVLDWVRELVGYTGPVFEDMTEAMGIEGRESRVAWGDMDADGDPDLLVGGRRILRNDGRRFTDVTEALGFAPAGPSGGLWADIDGDGRLDIVSVSSRSEGEGDGVWLQDAAGGYSLAAYSIDDSLPTEGAAVFDIDRDGLPELYCANYETPGLYNGNVDRLWRNVDGRLTPVMRWLRLYNPHDEPGDAQAGRGVAPADYDNDGDTEIYVCNYRLDRNFLLDPVFDATGEYWRLQDIAAWERLQGHDVDGWYGHSIGADWGDYDNDGDLDLFLANLAHPRYIAFSDKAMLLRNDGAAARMIGDEMVEFHMFSDVTAEAGIAYDELHSDPSWLDVDNDGDLDLFITSIYASERTYLYRNDGGRFTDITWLAGARVFNGWGAAVADFNGDGALDIAVGSGSGLHLLANRTAGGEYVRLQPVWSADGQPALLEGDDLRPGVRPLLGARVELDAIAPGGRRVTRIRELQGGKGTTSQHEVTLHFGVGVERPLEARLLLGGEVKAVWRP